MGNVARQLLIKQVLEPLSTSKYNHLNTAADEVLTDFVKRSLLGIRERMLTELNNPSR